MLTTQTKREKLAIVAPRYATEKSMKCSDTRGVQNNKDNLPLRVIVGNFAGEKKLVCKTKRCCEG